MTSYTTAIEYLIAVPFTSAIIAVGLLSAAYRARDRYHRRRGKRYIFRCKNCGYIYLYSKNRPMQSCPKCGHVSEIFRQ